MYLAHVGLLAYRPNLCICNPNSESIHCVSHCSVTWNQSRDPLFPLPSVRWLPSDRRGGDSPRRRRSSSSRSAQPVAAVAGRHHPSLPYPASRRRSARRSSASRRRSRGPVFISAARGAVRPPALLRRESPSARLRCRGSIGARRPILISARRGGRPAPPSTSRPRVRPPSAPRRPCSSPLLCSKALGGGAPLLRTAAWGGVRLLQVPSFSAAVCPSAPGRRVHSFCVAAMGSSAAAAPFSGLSFGSPGLDVKLDGSNYREWAFSLKMLLKWGGSASHLTDAPPAATATNEKEIQAWNLTDDRVMAIICMSTDLSIRSS